MFSKTTILTAAKLSRHCYTPHDPLPLELSVRKLLTFVCDEMTLQCSLYLDEKNNTVYCAVDGTGSLLTHNGRVDMWRNMQIIHGVLPRSKAHAHGGYTDAANTISLSIEDQLLEAESRGYRVIFVGHSAGGAIALLLAIEFAWDCITFGQPRACSSGTIDDRFNVFYKYLRVVNGSDLVPRVPWPIPWRYGHGGDVLYLPISPESPGVWNPSELEMLKDRLFIPVGRRLREHSSLDYLKGLDLQYVDPPQT